MSAATEKMQKEIRREGYVMMKIGRELLRAGEDIVEKANDITGDEKEARKKYCDIREEVRSCDSNVNNEFYKTIPLVSRNALLIINILVAGALSALAICELLKAESLDINALLFDILVAMMCFSGIIKDVKTR